jgi:hypothetical protein
MYQFDHIVHFVEYPEQAKQHFQQQGIHAVMGGQHEAWGTYNALSYFDLSYIEFIGIFDEELFLQAAKQTYTLQHSYEKNSRQNGFTRFALRTTEIAKDAEKFKEAGFEVIGPTKCFRTREDGSQITWQLLHIGLMDTKVDFPFFIQWDESDDNRREDFKKRGIIAPHKLGNLAIEEIHYNLPSLQAVEQLAKLCEATVEMKIDKVANCDVAEVQLPNVKLVFSRPLGDGPAWEEMLEHGYGIQKIVLSGSIEQLDIISEGAIYEFRA